MSVPVVQGTVVNPNAQPHHHANHSSSEESGSSDGEFWEDSAGPYKGQPIGSTPPYVRSQFVRKVYTILTFQLMLTVAIAAPIAIKLGKYWVVQNMWFYYLCMFATIGIMCCAACKQDSFRKFPSNYIMLFLFTAFESGLVGCIVSLYKVDSVILALATTVIIFTGLTFYACTTKTDFTGAGPYLFAALMCLMGISFVVFFMSIFFTIPSWVNTAYAAIGALIFSFYIVYDTQLIVGGRHAKTQFSVDDYCFAALNLYLDIINLFIMLLQLMGDR